MSIRLFNDDRAIESLRDSDFDAHSAYAEVIDNSIQAHASDIRIRFTAMAVAGSKGRVIRSVAFADNGTGMPETTLHRCLQLGWSSRYNDRDGIGRFGVGMTMGAIHECRRVEVWSRVAGSAGWLKVVMDLDDVKDGSVFIAEPVKSPLPTEHADLLASSDHGTLVVWSKYDRWSGTPKDLEEMLREFRIYCGRTYRDFIWGNPGLTLHINGELVHAIDPLYARTDKTRYPGDPKAEVYPDILVRWPRDDEQGEDTIVIRMSFLPESFRQQQGAGGSADAKDRYIDRNEGISILRNGREVFYGEPPFWGTGKYKWRFDDLDRWWGCEVRFPASLDRSFRVKNIKRGAEPILQLRNVIKKLITPTRNSLQQKVRDHWTRNGLKQGNGDNPAASPHSKAEQIAKTAQPKTPRGPLDIGVDPVKSQSEVIQQLGIYDAREQAALQSLFRSQPFTIKNTTWPGRDFIDITHMGGAAAIQYNMRHDFHRKTNELMQELVSSPENAQHVAEKMKTLIDLTFIAYAKAETMFEQQESKTAEAFISFLRSNWGHFLEVYVKTWESEEG